MKRAIQISNSMLMSDFIDELTLSKSQLTIDGYRYDVSKFIEFLLEKKVKRVTSIKREHIVLYLSTCKKSGKCY
jgi:site-specific recombinase XerD